MNDIANYDCFKKCQALKLLNNVVTTPLVSPNIYDDVLKLIRNKH